MKLYQIWKKLSRKKKIASISSAVVLSLVLIVVLICSGNDVEVTYRETTVEKGELVVGITESGSVDVGTVEQVFELDMSALERAQTGTSSGAMGNSSSFGGADIFGGSGGGMPSMGGSMPGGSGGGSSSGSRTSSGGNMFGDIFNMAGDGNGSGSGESIGNLSVSEVLVSVGQQVKEGDVLYLLEEESVAQLCQELEDNVTKAEADLNAVYAEQTLSKQSAQYTYDSSVAYGAYASVEYDSTIRSLENAVTEAEQDLAEAKELLQSYQEQVTRLASDYAAACEVLKNCEWSRDNTNKWNDTYLYVTYFEMVQKAQSNVNTLEQKKTQMEKNLTQAEENVTKCEDALKSAKRSLASGKLTAKENLELRELAYNTAQETYDIALGYLEDGAKEQEATYAAAKEKWDEYSTHIDENAVKSKYNGVVTEVGLAEGDSISTNDVLITLYDMEQVGMTVTVDEDDMKDIELGSTANVNFTAYPDMVFEAVVTEIADAETDNNGNVTMDVTITVQGDTSGLFQGMTGDITFITRQTKEVLYVSNRAIIRQGTSSYVKVRDEKGNIVKKEIVTGFSDGVNVEIKEGLSEGDVVLIESRVSES